MLHPFIWEWVANRGGSISAEHGIGFAKVDLLQMGKSDTDLTLMRNLKQLMDPKGILNPGKVLSKQ
jgi:FAD/FMN-containing dehydrogenase